MSSCQVKSVRAQTPLIFFVWMAPTRKWPAPLGLYFFTHPIVDLMMFYNKTGLLDIRILETQLQDVCNKMEPSIIVLHLQKCPLFVVPMLTDKLKEFLFVYRPNYQQNFTQIYVNFCCLKIKHDNFRNHWSKT